MTKSINIVLGLIFIMYAFLLINLIGLYPASNHNPVYQHLFGTNYVY